MEQQDRQAIEGLFSRLQSAGQQAGPRDVEAEAFINQQIARQPGAAYFMAQTIIMQEYAMQDAQRRIEALEQQAQRSSGGFLSGLFGGGRNRGPLPARPAAPMSAMSPMGMQHQPGRGGGFLAGAAQTAMGVAGGVLLGNAIAGMFSDAQAAEPSAEPAPEEDPGFAEDDGMDMEW